MKTESEIFTTPKILRESLKVRVDVEKLKDLIGSSEEVLFFGCGSSFHLGTTLSHLFMRKLKKSARAVLGSEILLSCKSNVLEEKRYVVFSISRSGETSETVSGTRKFKNMGYPVVALTCEPGSTLSRISDTSIVSPSREESVVMTQSFSSLLLIVIKAVKEMLGEDAEVLEELVDHSEVVLRTSHEFFKSVDLSRYEHFVFLGSGENLGISNESALKLKEMALVYSESHSTLDYRHGPKALVGERSFVLIQITPDEGKYVLDLKEEIEGYGARVVTVGQGGDIEIPKVSRGDDSFLRVIPSQVLGLELAKMKGLNPDSPEKLTKVVKLD